MKDFITYLNFYYPSDHGTFGLQRGIKSMMDGDVTVMVICCEEVAVLFGEFVLAGVTKEECEELAEQKRCYVAESLVYEQREKLE